MSSKKSEEFKKYLNKKGKSNKRAPVPFIAKSGKYLAKRSKHWRESDHGENFQGSKKK
ncbi:MAG TPA: hypothetical protein VJI67_04030 [archaeon]|nr:hypothetical protein [archaeon]HLD81045.1 hypothetical protein [archaeon]